MLTLITIKKMLKNKAYRLLFLFCLPIALYSQKPAELGLISDNDLYTSFKHDRYYTNGIEFYYRYLGNSKKENVAKKITEFRIGQYMYNPQSVMAEELKYHDRPFAGYLFGEAGINTFYQDESVLKMNFQLGIIGKESLAEGLQEQLHKLFGYPKVQGWNYQIPTTLAVQANIFYSNKIFANNFREKVDFHIQADANIGTIFTGITAGPMMRISLKNPLMPVYNSSLHGAIVNKDKTLYKEQREFYIYLNPNINYQIYDATIEGSLFNDKAPVTFPLIHLRFNAEAGIKYRINKWNFSYSFNYRGKELSNNVIEGYYYGSIAIGYLL